jgi:hypothetical protein
LFSAIMTLSTMELDALLAASDGVELAGGVASSAAA